MASQTVCDSFSAYWEQHPDLDDSEAKVLDAVRCYVIDIKGNVKYRTIDHIESSSISLPYINKAFFTRHPEDAVPDVRILEFHLVDRILLCMD